MRGREPHEITITFHVINVFVPPPCIIGTDIFEITVPCVLLLSKRKDIFWLQSDNAGLKIAVWSVYL